MLAAVEAWVKRDHDAEWKRWTGWLEHIAQKVTVIDGVTTEIVQPQGLSNKTPSLRVRWDRARLGVAGDAVVRTLFEGEPRITLTAAGGGDPSQTGVSITPYMMAAGEERIVADKLHAVLTKPPAVTTSTPVAPTTDLSGAWDVQIQFAAIASKHTLQLRQRGADIEGAHQGDFITRELTGSMDGDTVRLRSFIGEDSGDALSFTFNGKAAGGELSGTLDMGEYLGATWTAKRRTARGRR
jgi:L-seryl-tRNA(Ser) seleniumtransferase